MGFVRADEESGVENWKWLGKGVALCAQEILLLKGACDNIQTQAETPSLGFRSGNRNARKIGVGETDGTGKNQGSPRWSR